ncbi:MAG: ABC transporter ATP-binding protein [Limnohabitans sp.]
MSALQVRGLKVTLGSRQVLHGIDLEVAAGRWTSVVGPNGAGKSTLLKAMAGLLPTQGAISWHERPLAQIARRDRARQMSWLGQGEPASLDLRVLDVVMLGRLPSMGWWNLPGIRDRAMVEAALRATQAWDWRERTLGELSAGERQRVLLARALAGNAPLMLMDEPLINLDPPHQVDWLEQMLCLKAQGTTVVSVLHEVGMALEADDLVVMDQGRVLHHGPAADPATRAALEKVFDSRVRMVFAQGHWVAVPRMTSSHFGG